MPRWTAVGWVVRGSEQSPPNDLSTAIILIHLPPLPDPLCLLTCVVSGGIAREHQAPRGFPLAGDKRGVLSRVSANPSEQRPQPHSFPRTSSVCGDTGGPPLSPTPLAATHTLAKSTQSRPASDLGWPEAPARSPWETSPLLKISLSKLQQKLKGIFHFHGWRKLTF